VTSAGNKFKSSKLYPNNIGAVDTRIFNPSKWDDMVLDGGVLKKSNYGKANGKVYQSGSSSNVSRTRWGAEHGKGNVKHNNAIETELDTAFMDGATDLRKNRVQRDVNGNRVYAADGTYTRPDASYVLNGKRYNTNYISNYMLDDIDELNRELDAFRRMVEADPDAITRLEFDY